MKQNYKECSGFVELSFSPDPTIPHDLSLLDTPPRTIAISPEPLIQLPLYPTLIDLLLHQGEISIPFLHSLDRALE